MAVIDVGNVEAFLRRTKFDTATHAFERKDVPVILSSDLVSPYNPFVYHYGICTYEEWRAVMEMYLLLYGQGAVNEVELDKRIKHLWGAVLSGELTG